MLWERFTEQALKAFLNAKNWANRLRSPTVTPEHLLLGLLDDESALAVQLLQQWGVDPQQLRAEMERQLALTAPRRPPTEPPIWSPALQQTVHWAAEEARALRENRIESVHLLLGLLRDRHNPAARWLARYGLLWDELRRRVHAMKASEPEQATPPRFPADVAWDLTAKVDEGDIQPVPLWQRERLHLKLALLQGKHIALLGDWDLAVLLAEQAAWDLAQEMLPETLRGRRLFWVNGTALMARADRDAALADVIDAAQAMLPQPVLVLGALEWWAAMGHLCAALAQRHICAVTLTDATRWDGFARRLPDLAALFCPIRIGEPTAREALEWLRAHKHRYEQQYRLEISEEALLAAIKKAAHAPSRPLLTAARQLLEAACAYAQLDAAAPQEMRDLQAELTLLHAQMQDLIKVGDHEHLPALMERAFVLQKRLDDWRTSPSPSPCVGAAHIYATAQLLHL